MSDDTDGTISWRSLLAETTTTLERAGLPGAARDARILVAEAVAVPDAELALHLDELATVRRLAWLDRSVARRVTGEPLAHVLGHWPFRSLDLLVDRRVLIPRPETEQVAGWALEELDALRRPDPLAVDLGCGSGAIGLAIAVERSTARVWLTDVDDDAVAVARANLAGLGRRGAGVRIAAGSWFAALPDELAGTVDLVVSNPPYVAPGDEIGPEVADWEPAGALWTGVPGDEAGTAALDELVDGAPSWLADDGALVVELQPAQADGVAERAGSRFAEVEVRVDHADRPRAVVARRPSR